MYGFMRFIVGSMVLLAIGLAVCIVVVFGLVILATVFGVMTAFLALGFLVLKLALLIALPLLAIGWVVKRMFTARHPEWERDVV